MKPTHEIGVHFYSQKHTTFYELVNIRKNTCDTDIFPGVDYFYDFDELKNGMTYTADNIEQEIKDGHFISIPPELTRAKIDEYLEKARRYEEAWIEFRSLEYDIDEMTDRQREGKEAFASAWHKLPS